MIQTYHDIEFDGKKYQRVVLGYMYNTINKNPETKEKIEQKINTVSKNFSNVYKTFNKEKTIEISINEKIELEKKIKELGEKLKTSEGTKQNKNNLIKEENKIKIKEKMNYEEEKKKIEEEKKKMFEEEKMLISI